MSDGTPTPPADLATIFPLEDALLLRQAGLHPNRSERTNEVGRVTRILMRKHPHLYRPEALAQTFFPGDK